MRSRRGHSSVGRAPALQAGGRRFDPVWLHQTAMLINVQTRRVSVPLLTGQRFLDIVKKGYAQGAGPSVHAVAGQRTRLVPRAPRPGFAAVEHELAEPQAHIGFISMQTGLSIGSVHQPKRIGKKARASKARAAVFPNSRWALLMRAIK